VHPDQKRDRICKIRTAGRYDEGNELTLREYLAIAKRWWWLAALGCLLAGSSAFVVTSQMTPVYRAEAWLLVNQAQNPSAVTYQDILGSQQLTRRTRTGHVESQSEGLRSEAR